MLCIAGARAIPPGNDISVARALYSVAPGLAAPIRLEFVDGGLATASGGPTVVILIVDLAAGGATGRAVPSVRPR